MPPPTLYIFVEGPEDQTFFQGERIYRLAQAHYPTIHVRTWTEESKEDLVALVLGAVANGADYIFLVDKDSKFSCIEMARQYALNRCPVLDPARILVVIREIECWYVAGVDQTFTTRFGFSPPNPTDDFTKSRFRAKAAELKFANKTDMMVEILKTYSVELAIGRNTSFARLIARYLPPRQETN